MHNDEIFNNTIAHFDEFLIFLVSSRDIKSFQQNSDKSYTVVFNSNKAVVFTIMAIKRGFQYLLKRLYDLSLDETYSFQEKSKELYYSILIYEICEHINNDIFRPVFFEECDDTIYFYDINENKIAFSKEFGSFEVSIYNKYLQ